MSIRKDNAKYVTANLGLVDDHDLQDIAKKIILKFAFAQLITAVPTIPFQPNLSSISVYSLPSDGVPRASPMVPPSMQPSAFL